FTVGVDELEDRIQVVGVPGNRKPRSLVHGLPRADVYERLQPVPSIALRLRWTEAAWDGGQRTDRDVFTSHPPGKAPGGPWPRLERSHGQKTIRPRACSPAARARKASSASSRAYRLVTKSSTLSRPAIASSTIRGNSTIGLPVPYRDPSMRRSPTINSRGLTAKVSPVPGRPITTSTPRLARISRPCSIARVLPTATKLASTPSPVIFLMASITS